MYADQVKRSEREYYDMPVAATQLGERQMEVRGGMERLDRRVSNLSELVSALDQRLTGYIARPEVPQPANPPGQIKGARSTELGGQLDAVADSIDSMTLRLQSLMERLET